MGAGASAESSSAALAAAGEVKSEAAAKAVQDAVASLPKLQQDSAAAMFDKAGSAMTSEQLTSAAQDVISSAGKIEAGEGAQAAVAAVGAAINQAARMAPEVTAAVGTVRLGVAEHRVRSNHG